MKVLAFSIFLIYDGGMSLLITVPDEVKAAASVAQSLSATDDATVVVPGKEPVRLPQPLLKVLSAAAQAFAEGKEVVVGSQDTFLTTQEAADIIGVSRPTMVKLLESGEVPFERPNSHRRIRLGDLAAYDAAESSRRRAVLDQMSEDFSDLARHPETFIQTR